jgi:hypothetical protein
MYAPRTGTSNVHVNEARSMIQNHVVNEGPSYRSTVVANNEPVGNGNQRWNSGGNVGDKPAFIRHTARRTAAAARR